jgi:ABC-type proline/glycine betaine transport system permease subunit
MDGKLLFIQNAKTQLEHRIQSSALGGDARSAVHNRVVDVDVTLVAHLCSQSLRSLTTTNLSYILCFLAGLDTQTIATIFMIEPASVYSVRYRLRAYFPKKTILPF